MTLPTFQTGNRCWAPPPSAHSASLHAARRQDSRRALVADVLNQAMQMWGDRYEVQITMHHWPTWGNAEITQLIKVQRDIYKFMHDQTLHYANMGYTMDELPSLVTLPQSLASRWASQGYYGTQSHDVRARN